MSTIAEHLAALELHKMVGDHEQFHSEVYLFMQVHWAELIAQQDPAEMQCARLEIEKRMVDQHGDRGQAYVDQWRQARPVVAAAQVRPPLPIGYANADDVVQMQKTAQRGLLVWAHPGNGLDVPIYTRPAAQPGGLALTAEQINELANGDAHRADNFGAVWPHSFARAVEAAHGVNG